MLTDGQRFIVKDMEINFVVMSYGFYSLPNNATKVDALVMVPIPYILRNPRLLLNCRIELN